MKFMQAYKKVYVKKRNLIVSNLTELVLNSFKGKHGVKYIFSNKNKNLFFIVVYANMVKQYQDIAKNIIHILPNSPPKFNGDIFEEDEMSLYEIIITQHKKDVIDMMKVQYECVWSKKQKEVICPISNKKIGHSMTMQSKKFPIKSRSLVRMQKQGI